MKFSIVALVAILALFHGTECVSLAKRDVQSEVDRITQLIKDMSATFNSATLEMVEKVKALEVTGTAQSYATESRTKIQPLVEKVQAEAAKLQQQVKPFIANIEELTKPLTENLNAQVQPLTDSVQAQVKPLTDSMMDFFRQVAEQTKALLPPQ
ncbi:type-4 ice-structuring protein-like [Synchiropus splendidus]|uniref:type-4 ice-structuring protein-like n=1 Tax=Synchiropus splendidus TaxID=270530 RepID=UPI00237EBC32|nr:type-4 ice-structuring protein-like [Synchiropus splendidus]